MPLPQIHVIGAAGRLGSAVCRALHAARFPLVAIVRDPVKWSRHALPADLRIADLAAPPTIRAALADATHVIATSHATWTSVILAATGPDTVLVLTGTARALYGTTPDAFADAARAAERLLATRRATILHPTMIYGSDDDGTVGRLAALLGRTRILPVPGANRLVQPVHVDDVAAALVAAISRATATRSIPLAGPTPLPYADLIRAVAAAAGLPRPWLIPIPDLAVHLAAHRAPGLRRMLDDRIADPAPMRIELGVTPRPLQDGLRAMFSMERSASPAPRP